MCSRECKPAGAPMVPENLASRPRGEKKPGRCRPGLGVWERMPERPGLCAPAANISQVRKAQSVLIFLQLVRKLLFSVLNSVTLISYGRIVSLIIAALRYVGQRPR